MLIRIFFLASIITAHGFTGKALAAIQKPTPMRKSVLIFLLLLSIQGYSQIKMGLNIKPEISFANSDIYWTNCSYGIATNFQIYKWFSISFGIGYQAKNYDFTKMPYTTDQYPINNYLLHTIPIYLMPKVNFLNFCRNFKFYGIAGTSINSCIYEKTTYVEESSPTETSSEICFYNLLINLGLGLEYNISKFSIFIEPAFNTIVAKNSNYYQPYSNTVSLNIGCFYNLKNK